MASLSDAQIVTGATSGKVITELSVGTSSLTAAQKTALVTFVTSLGTWPGVPANIVNVSVQRVPANPTQISATIVGFVVHADANAALDAMMANPGAYNLLGKVT